MGKKEAFLWAVQTGCLVRALRENWDIGHPVRIMASATSIPEDVIPDDVDEAAYSFLQWQFKYGSVDEGIKPPKWLEDLVSGSVEETGYWKF
jgi:hypothetical protein